jgi:predicted transcriptional regulator
MTPAELRRKLQAARNKRQALELERSQHNADVAALLSWVAETDGITMTEAADILGVSRVMAYKMLKR